MTALFELPKQLVQHHHFSGASHNFIIRFTRALLGLRKHEGMVYNFSQLHQQVKELLPARATIRLRFQ